MSDIVEWLREMQDEYAPGGGGVQYHENYKAAADRIEALEKDNGLLRALLLGVEHCHNCTICKSNAVQVRAALNEGKL